MDQQITDPVKKLALDQVRALDLEMERKGQICELFGELPWWLRC